MIGEDIPVVDDEEQSNRNGKTGQSSGRNGGYTVPKLRKGQEIIIQITKEPVNNKGVRVTSSVSLPGRFCVLLPYDNKIGVSKKITDFKERRRLRYIARSILPENYGLIIRTVAKHQSEQALKDDLQALIKNWYDIEGNAKSEKPPFPFTPGSKHNVKCNQRFVQFRSIENIHRFKKTSPGNKKLCKPCSTGSC